MKRNAFFMIEIIISTVIISGVIITLFKVKDNNIKIVSKIDKKNIKESIVLSFLPYLKKNENKSQNILDIFDLKNMELKEKISTLKIKNNVLLEEKKLKIGENSFSVKKILLIGSKNQKLFYSFYLNENIL